MQNISTTKHPTILYGDGEMELRNAGMSSDLLHICSNKPKCDDYRTDDGCLKKWCKGMGFDHQQCKAVSLKCGWLSQEDLDSPTKNPAPPAYVSHSGRNVGPGMGNQTWTNEEDCYEFAIGKGAFFFQKAGNRCYVYGAGSASGACGNACWAISTHLENEEKTMELDSGMSYASDPPGMSYASDPGMSYASDPSGMSPCDTLFLQGKEVETLNPRQKMLINDDDVLNQWFRKGRRGGYRRNCTDANGDNISSVECNIVNELYNCVDQGLLTINNRSGQITLKTGSPMDG